MSPLHPLLHGVTLDKLGVAMKTRAGVGMDARASPPWLALLTLWPPPSLPPSPDTRLVGLSCSSVSVTTVIRLSRLQGGREPTSSSHPQPGRVWSRDPFRRGSDPSVACLCTHVSPPEIWTDTEQETRAIMQYLMNKYATEGTQYLYPKEPEERAKVDRMLFFDMGTLYHAIKEYFGPKIHQGMPPDQEKENLLKTSLDYLDHFLEIGGVPYLCGERITIADIAILASITELDALNYSYKCYGELFRWSERVKEGIPCYKECCIEGVEMTRARVKQLEDDLKKQMEKERKASITKK